MPAFRLAALFAALALLPACELLEPAQPNTPASLLFLNTAGETAEINGTWRASCVAATPASSQVTVTFLGSQHVLVTLAWDVVDDCSGDPDTVELYPGEIEINDEKSVGWSPAAPTGLPDPVTATTYTFTLEDPADFGAGEVSEALSAGVVDATVTPNLMYIGSGFDTSLTPGSDGYPDALIDVPYAAD